MRKRNPPLVLRLILTGLSIAVSFDTFAQQGVGIGTSTPKAALDVSSTTGGFLPPRMSREQRDRLDPLTAGLVVYQEDHTPGLYLYNGAAWIALNPDDLGSHNATQRLNLQDKLLVGADAAGGQPGTAGLRVTSSGHVGIGTSTPSEKLDVTGSVKASEKVEAERLVGKTVVADVVEAEQFKYASAKNYVLNVPGSAFTSLQPGTYRANFQFVPGSTLTPGSVFLEGGDTERQGYLSAPIVLPQFAVITGLGITGLNTDKDGEPEARVILSAMAPHRTTYAHISEMRAVLEAQAMLPNTFNPTIQGARTDLNHVVRNDQNFYQLTIIMSQNSSKKKIIGVTIQYTVTEPD